MIDPAIARRKMVDGQIRTSDVTDLRIIAAMLEIPRERFVPAANAELAYLDLDVPLSAAGAPMRRLLKPMVLAKLIQGAEIAESDKVLDVGCATGYSSAVLARLAASVVALEENAALLQACTGNLRAVGADRVSVVTGPLTEGAPTEGPYDVIVLEGASEEAPRGLLHQLKDGGRLVGVIGRAPAAKAMLYLAAGREVSGRALFDAAAPLLPGFAAPAAFVF
jgi:protein-L-isoaspartate(D-aspartate) O-methyltransferase